MPITHTSSTCSRSPFQLEKALLIISACSIWVKLLFFLSRSENCLYLNFLPLGPPNWSANPSVNKYRVVFSLYSSWCVEKGRRFVEPRLLHQSLQVTSKGWRLRLIHIFVLWVRFRKSININILVITHRGLSQRNRGVRFFVLSSKKKQLRLLVWYYDRIL